MGRKVYTKEFKEEVVEYFKTHTVAETMQKFGVSRASAYKWALKGCTSKGQGNPLNFRHEVCQYYDNHTGVETLAKFGVTADTICRWRRELGYRNKSRGYNLYTEGLQPTVTKRERRNFVMTKAENGQLQGELMEIKLQYAVLEREFKQLKEVIMEAIQ
jgi:transposase-like protein